jgi:hypothetical protein
LTCLLVPSARALSWKAYDAHRHERFTGGLPSSPKPNKNFFAGSYDLSGVGWDAADGGKTVALISPKHFLGAKHWQLKGSVSFMGRDGTVHRYEVERHETLSKDNDISIGVLKNPIPAADKIAFYGVAAVPTPDWYLGRTAISFGQKGKAGRTVIKSFRTYEPGHVILAFMYDRLPDEPQGDGVKGISGDSGAPSFLVEGGQLVLFGHHAQNVQDSFPAGYFMQVAAILAKDGYQLKPAPVTPGPEMVSRMKVPKTSR